MLAQPLRAPVMPRVTSPETGDSIPLVDLLESYLDAGVYLTVRIEGCGKSTALRHIAAAFADRGNVALFDNPAPHEIERHTGQQLVVYASERLTDADVKLTLQPWRQDDLIELLLAEHPQQCKSVFGRLHQADDCWLTVDNPELWRIVLDEMAANSSILCVEQALVEYFDSRVLNTNVAVQVADKCLKSLRHESNQTFSNIRPPLDNQVERLLKYPTVRLVLAARRLPERLQNSTAVLRDGFPKRLLELAARRIHDNKFIIQQLQKAVLAKDRRAAGSASLLVRAVPGWRPPSRSHLNLCLAYLDGVDWPAVNLLSADLLDCQLSGADLSGADLSSATVTAASFFKTDLHGARLTKLFASRTLFRNADLRNVQAEAARFWQSDFEGADLSGGCFRNADFQGANLASAKLVNAKLLRAKLTDANLDGTDLSGADLSAALLKRLDFRTAILHETVFCQARMIRSNLEDVHFIGASFEGASLRKALLTGSTMPSANFQRCELNGTGLADIAWENCDLRYANLRGCTFHMGSSRSGLVDSPYPSHGTRTGFYTDEFEEQYFKRPEEIRKANLCGADLRGANITDVDFYLVDLRGAKCDSNQLAHLRRTGAILEDR